MGEHERNCVKLVPIFQNLPTHSIEALSELVTTFHYSKGETVYDAGSAAASLLIIGHGQVKLTQLSANGKEQLLRILDPGDFDGEYALFVEQQRQSYATALTDTEVCQIKRQDFQTLLVDMPQVAVQILAEFAKRISQLETQTTRVTTESVETRLALFLIDNAPQSQQTAFRLPMKKKELAAYLGTTPETISRKLTLFEQEGYLKQEHQQLTILDPDGLALI